MLKLAIILFYLHVKLTLISDYGQVLTCLYLPLNQRDLIHASVIAAPLHHCHPVLILSAHSTCRFAERLFLFLFSLVIFLCLTEFLCKECPRVHIHFERVDIKEIPAEPVFFRRWLHERFEIKDR